MLPAQQAFDIEQLEALRVHNRLERDAELARPQASANPLRKFFVGAGGRRFVRGAVARQG